MSGRGLPSVAPWIVLALGAAVRLAAWRDWQGWAGGDVAILDAAWHLDWGRRLAAGLPEPARTWIVAPGLAWLFAAIEGAAALLGRPLPQGGAQTGLVSGALLALDLLAVELIRRLGAGLAGEQRGWWVGGLAGLLAATSGPLVFHAVSLMGTPPAMVLLGLAGLGLLSPSPARSLGAGLALALACYFRPNLLALAPLLALLAMWPLPGARPDPRRAAALGLGFALGLAPGLLRNGLVGGEWVPLSANAGANLFMAHAPGPISYEGTPPEGPVNLGNMTATFQAGAEAALGRPLKPAEADAYWMQQAKARMAADPRATLQRFAARGWAGLATWSLHDHYAWPTWRKGHPIFRALPDLGLILPGLALLGVGLGWRAGRRREVVILAGIWLGVAASLAPFSVVERYRICGQVGAIPLMALGLGLALAEGPASRRLARLGLAAGLSLLLSLDPLRGRLVLPDALASGAVVSWSEAVGPNREATQEANLAAAFVREQRLAEAEPFLRHAVALAPDRLDDQVSLAGVLLALGQRAEGLALLDAVLARAPGHVTAALARCGAQLQDSPAEAAAACARATQVAPDRWEAWFQLGLARWGSGDLGGAAVALDRALALNPALPRGREARAQLAREQAAVVDPGAEAPSSLDGP